MHSGMRGTVHILIPLAVVVAFICAFFAFFTYDQLIAKSVSCLKNPAGKLECSFKDVGANVIVGMVLIGFLLVVMLGVLYLVAKFLTSPEVLTGGAPTYQGGFSAH